MVALTHRWKKQVFTDAPTLRPETRIKRQVDGIEKLLGLKHRNRILDVGCGAGSQSLELGRRKYRVVGMGVSPHALAGARACARTENLTVHFVANDMRRIPYCDEFNAVINLRNPIGFYVKERDDMRCLEGACAALKKGGKLMLDLLNREWLIRRLGSASREESKSQSFDLCTGRLDARGFSARGGRPKHLGDKLRIYSLTEIIRMLADVGLSFRDVCGSYDGKFYGVDSQRMIVIAEKVHRARRPTARQRDDLPSAVRIKGRRRG